MTEKPCRNATKLGPVDVDAFVLAHRATWDRLDTLVKRRKKLSGDEVDELVELYQRVSTHLSMVRSSSTDSVLVGRLSTLVAYRARRWWLATALVFFAVALLIGAWVVHDPAVQATLGTPTDIDVLVN